MVFGGIYEQSDQIKAAASEALDKVQGWINDARGGRHVLDGRPGAALDGAETGKTLLQGIGNGIEGLTSLVFFLTFTAFATFFLLKDGPTVRRFVDRHLGVPPRSRRSSRAT